MTDAQINELASQVLRESFKDYGFREAIVHSAEDFDGSPIIRILARVETGDLPADRFADALHEIRSKLLGKGEERFVLLSSVSPEDEFIDEDVD